MNCETEWISKRSTQTGRPFSLSFSFSPNFSYVRKISSTILFCAYTHTHTKPKPYGNGTFLLFFRFSLLDLSVGSVSFGESHIENELNCQNNKRMTSFQTRDLSFTTKPCQATGNSAPASKMHELNQKYLLYLLFADFIPLPCTYRFAFVHSILVNCRCELKRIQVITENIARKKNTHTHQKENNNKKWRREKSTVKHWQADEFPLKSDKSVSALWFVDYVCLCLWGPKKCILI